MKKFIFTFGLLCLSTFCFSQVDSIKTRKYTRYLGVQANQLIRQILNFTNSSSSIDNPYLIIYAANSNKTGVGFTAGLGFQVNQTTDGDPSNKRETKINNLSARVGVEKKSVLGKKWLVSWGLDVTRDDFKNETTITQVFDPNNPSSRSVSNTTNTTSSWGFGPRFTLNFLITNRIVLGTETNYYYRSGSISTANNTTNSFSNGQGGFTTQTTKADSSSDFTKFQFSVPTVIYVMIKF